MSDKESSLPGLDEEQRLEREVRRARRIARGVNEPTLGTLEDYATELDRRLTELRARRQEIQRVPRRAGTEDHF